MNDSKHTPGPWATSPYAGRHDWGVYSESDGRDVALVRGDHEANARLIAASPSMYQFIEAKASEGDLDAAKIIAAIAGTR